MLDPVALAWASWIGVALGVAGLLVSTIGLWLTFREARKARTAAQEAAVQVAKVLTMSRARTRLSALSSTVTQADTISLRITDASLSREQITAFRRSVMEAIAVASVGSPDITASSDMIITSLERLASLLVNQVAWPAKQDQMQAELEKVTSFLISQEANARTEDYT